MTLASVPDAFASPHKKTFSGLEEYIYRQNDTTEATLSVEMKYKNSWFMMIKLRISLILIAKKNSE